MEVITPEIDSAPQVQPDTAKPGDVGDVVKVEPAHQPVSEDSAPPIVPRRD